MTSQTPTGKTLVNKVEQIKEEIAKTTDLNKLFKDNEFVKQLKTLPNMEQFKIFQQYKDQFNQISKDPKSAIAKWTGNLTKSFPVLGEDNLNNGIQQISESLRNSLGKISPK
jgi:hypothetical protein